MALTVKQMALLHTLVVNAKDDLTHDEDGYSIPLHESDVEHYTDLLAIIMELETPEVLAEIKREQARILAYFKGQTK